MGKITEPYNINGEWAVKITRRNGKPYVVKSPDKQSIEDYRQEFLNTQKQRMR